MLVGVVIWAVALTLARRFGKPGGSAVADTTLAFITIWFLAIATRSWLAAAESARSVRELTPQFVLVFGVPAAIAAAVRWKYFPSIDSA